jgi:hypothetical protein
VDSETIIITELRDTEEALWKSSPQQILNVIFRDRSSIGQPLGEIPQYT